jgi:flagellin-like hook-associated protein FlgL
VTPADHEQFTAIKRGIPGSGEVYKMVGQLLFAASEGLLESTPDTDMLTAQIEDVQAKVNTARVQAGSQYAAIESAVNYTTDLTAQYELGFNTVSDVNFSMETAHLAKNQILQQAATAMLAQANQGQQGYYSSYKDKNSVTISTTLRRFKTAFFLRLNLNFIIL